MDTIACWFVFLIPCVTGLPLFAANAGASKLHCGASVTAEVGDSVTLQCLTKPQRDVSKERVEWMRVNDEVHLRRDGKDDFTDQMLAYKDRTSLSASGLSKGDCSLTLSNVKESDSGTYQCSVKIKKEEECSVTFTVRPREEKASSGDQHLVINPTEKPGHSQTIYIGGVGSILVILSIVGGIFVILKCKPSIVEKLKCRWTKRRQIKVPENVPLRDPTPSVPPDSSV